MAAAQNYLAIIKVVGIGGGGVNAINRMIEVGLKGAGFDAYVARADLGARGVWYRVRVGRYASREEAQRAVAKLRGSGRASDAIIQAYDGP